MNSVILVSLVSKNMERQIKNYFFFSLENVEKRNIIFLEETVARINITPCIRIIYLAMITLAIIRTPSTTPTKRYSFHGFMPLSYIFISVRAHAIIVIMCLTTTIRTNVRMSQAHTLIYCELQYVNISYLRVHNYHLSCIMRKVRNYLPD